ncbi:hypothetical protein A0H81_12978 [Grifola frondosa]|uniref:Uncharacterized protein n=1 Tax=Grifola frondosa TaxID=5627 RepID=A0A1C7LQN5_GRIFR|nr:hypothetical protein A0H81_12978 [Grifola frondosa]
MDNRDRAWRSYEKAKATGLAYDLTIHDFFSLTPKFWELHNDPIVLLDGGAITTTHHSVQPVRWNNSQYRKHGQFLMTELGHGLDIGNIETTATLLPSGEFLLNSPTPQAAKFMPPPSLLELPALPLSLLD